MDEEKKKKKVVEDDVHLCTSFCDMLIDLSSSRWIPFDALFRTKVEFALEKCEPNHCGSEDTYFSELRGVLADKIRFVLISELCFSIRTSVKYLNLVVGCKAHGIGKGNLRNMVLSLLETDKRIKFDCTSDVSIISIEIDREWDYLSVPWNFCERQQPHTDAENAQESEPVSSFSTEGSRMSAKRNEEGPLASSNDTIISEPEPPFSQGDVNEVYDKPSAVTSAGSNLDEEVPLSIAQRYVDENSEKIFLCTVVCDFLSGLQKPWGERWEETFLKVLAGLEKCCSGVGNKDIGTCTIDLRGRFANEARIMLIDLLNCRPFPRYLDVIVGCELHGIGEGKLKKIVCEVLERYQLKFSSVFNDSCITIQLDGWEDYTSYGCINQPLPDVYEDNDVSEDSENVGSSDWTLLGQKMMPVDEEVVPGVAALLEIYKSSMEEVSLCSFVCDFLSDLPTPPGQWWDERATGKVLAGLRKCYGSASIEDVEGTLSVDIRGQHVDEAIKQLLKTLYQKPAKKYLKLIVGCKVHGIGKGKLKNAIIDLLVGLDIKCDPDAEAFVISIELGSVNMLLIEKMMSQRKVPHGIGIDSGNHLELSEDFLCSILCDLLFDIPKQFPNQRWDVKLVAKVLGALELCDSYFCTNEDLEGGTYTIDLRGEPAHVSERKLVDNLIRWSPYFERLNFIVGCTRHGVGEGKLRDMVSGVLNRDKTIKWELVKQAIISVELDGEKDYNLLKSDLSTVSSAPLTAHSSLEEVLPFPAPSTGNVGHPLSLG